MNRFAEVEEISKSILFLASLDASYITGVNLQVDGGKIKSIWGCSVWFFHSIQTWCEKQNKF